MRTLVAECRADVPEGLPSALACLVGYFGYETVGLVETLPQPEVDPLGLPDMIFVRPTVVLVFDRLADALYLVAPVWPDASRDAARMIAEAEDRLDATAARLATATLPAPIRAELPEPAYEPALAPGRYAEMVARAKDYIVAGDIFQVVLAQRFSAPFTLPPFELYRSLRRINPSPFLYHLDLPGISLIGSSPEILVRVRNDEVTIRPIAGTRPRGKTRAEDAANRDSLLADPKERAEHLMLLDLGRNDVGRAATAGSVRVTDSYTVEFYSHVMHIVSNVVGRLGEDKDALDALFAGFPAGTVSGAPKVRACQIIAELEPERRGAYAGGVGYFSPDGSMDSCIVLRTAVVRTAPSMSRRVQASSPTATRPMNSANAKPRPARCSPPRGMRWPGREKAASGSSGQGTPLFYPHPSHPLRRMGPFSHREREAQSAGRVRVS